MTKLLSASRLNDFLGCQHHAALWLAGVEPPPTDDVGLDLVRRKGFEHEALVLRALERVRGSAVAIAERAPLEERVAATKSAVLAGAPLIYQGAFANDRWIGFPDFLVRKGQSADGAWLYEPEDAKLARKAKAGHLIQLNIYAKLLSEGTSSAIARGAIHVGGGGAPEGFDLRQTQHITDRLMMQLEAFAKKPQRITKPVKSAACGQCAFQPRCEAEWRAADSPVFIAGITGDQIIKFERANITTLSQIAKLEPSTSIERLASHSVAKLVNQARLQKDGAKLGQALVELLPVIPSRGFTLLPRPAKGDIFFDMEGDPLYPEGLEYLFGIFGPLGPEGTDAFVPIWAHDRDAEKLAFEKLIALFGSHLDRFPRARIYHYAAYETAALKRLAMRHATMEAELDRMLREQRFVDLYKVARQAIRASTEGYSLKDLEKIYWRKRDGEVTNAGDSIVEYERWRETADQAILNAIGHYNEDDCVSTARMRDWLEGLRPPGAEFGLTDLDEELDPEDEARAAAREAFEEQRRNLAAAIRSGTVGDAVVRDLLAELPWFHQRAQKPVWWQIFDRQTWTDEELTEDMDSLGGLSLVSQVPDKSSFVATYKFEPQDTRLKIGASPKISETIEPAGTIQHLNLEDGFVVLRRGVKKGDFPQSCSLSPGAPINQKKLVASIIRLLERLVADPTSDQAFIDLLTRRAPRLAGRDGGPVVGRGNELVASAIAAVRDLDRSALIIQGPPGTGKTYTTARAIVALLQNGKRVAVSSNSHKAINNVLAAVEAHAEEIGFHFSGAKKSTAREEETAFRGKFVVNVDNSDAITPAFQLVGGTAYHFAADDVGAYDHLFVDEAGQVALGNLAAMAGCARNLVLVGDQMQLPQPVQGVHPGESGLSCLDYAMQDHATVPAERGILLNVSRRMHPAICGFISEAIYDGRLTAHSSTSDRRLVLGPDAHPALTPAGLRVIELDHEGCTQSSAEEADTVRTLVENLLRQRFANGVKSRALKLDDIVVVSPFNMQVDLLKRHLPPGARVGTVDKFQGQEAPVVIVSMATSFGGDAPRGTEFLFNRNRLNVAISRAECLAIIVHGRRLLDLPAATRADLPRLDLVAWASVVASQT